MHDGPKMAEKEGVNTSIKQLDFEIAGLIEELDKLYACLEPALIPPEPVPEGDEVLGTDQPKVSLVRSEIDHESAKILKIKLSVRDAIERLDL